MSQLLDKDILKRNYEFITNEIDAQDLVGFLLQNEAISFSDGQRIVRKRSKVEMNKDLVDTILRSSSTNAVKSFLKSLEAKYKHVLDRLEQAGTIILILPDLLSGSRTHITKPGTSGYFNQSIVVGPKRRRLDLLDSEEQEDAIEKLRQENKELQNKLVQDRADTIEKLRQENKELQDKLAKKQEDKIEKLRQENKQLHDKLDKELELTIENLMKENKRLENKLANLSTFKTKEIEFRLSEEETVEDHIKYVELTRDTSTLGQNDNTSSHQKCVPVRDFLLTHLPPCYQDVEMLNLIKSLADISVKIEGKDVDDKRKQFSDFAAQATMLDSKPIDTKTVPKFRNSDVKSASLMKPGSSSTSIDSQMDVNTSDIISSSHLLGSGKVDDVFIRTEADYGPCPCHRQCQEWGEIRVLTSAQLMYDDDDAKHFVCTFFYDDDDKRMDQQKSARGDRIVLRDLKKDVCMFLCMTCDVGLVRTLEGMLDKFEQSWENAFDKYANTVTWENERLTVIVSHPYGLRKHISLGKSWNPNVESSEKRIEYDNPTFNGSSGAFVLIPDFDVSDDV